jgi:hypothetical protein
LADNETRRDKSGPAPPSGIAHLILNGKALHSKDASRIISSLSDRALLTAKGGYLLKAAVIHGRCYLALLPHMVDGVRQYHYTMQLPVEDPHELGGFINSNGSIEWLFRMDALTHDSGPSRDYLRTISEHYVRIARLFLEHGFNGEFSLDFATRNVLGELGLFKGVPQTLADLAHQPINGAANMDGN